MDRPLWGRYNLWSAQVTSLHVSAESHKCPYQCLSEVNIVISNRVNDFPEVLRSVESSSNYKIIAHAKKKILFCHLRFRNYEGLNKEYIMTNVPLF